MSRSGSFTSLLRRAGLPAAAIIAMAFFGYYATLGPNGLLRYRDYQDELTQQQVQYAALDQERADLRNQKALLNPQHANPDMVDELARKDLDVVDPDEVIIPLK